MGLPTQANLPNLVDPDFIVPGLERMTKLDMVIFDLASVYLLVSDFVFAMPRCFLWELGIVSRSALVAHI